MNFSYHYLGYLNQGQKLSITLNQQAHVAILDTLNLNRYIHHKNFRHYGNLQSYSEEQYSIPASGEWHVVVYSNSSLQKIECKIIFK